MRSARQEAGNSANGEEEGGEGANGAPQAQAQHHMFRPTCSVHKDMGMRSIPSQRRLHPNPCAIATLDSPPFPPFPSYFPHPEGQPVLRSLPAASSTLEMIGNNNKSLMFPRSTAR